jgi:hypothetical protein
LAQKNLQALGGIIMSEWSCLAIASELLCGGNSKRELVSTVMASENDDPRIYRDCLGAGGVSDRVEGEMAAIDNVNLR